MTSSADPCGNCDRVLEEMDSYLDHELDEERMLEIKAHLRRCTECLDEYRLESYVKTLIARGCGPNPAPPAVHDRVRAKMRMLVVEMVGKEYRFD